MLNILNSGTKELGIEFDITLNQASKFITYKDLLLEWNEKINLTAITDEKEIFIKHFLDSMSVLPFLPKKEQLSLIDIGTGAGFPGIPLKIIRNDINLTLLDSLLKRVNFLNLCAEKLELSHVSCVHARAEDCAHSEIYREKYDAAVSRAVAKMDILAEYCLGYVKVGGRFIAMKGPDVSQEIKDAESVIKKLGGEINDIKTIKLPSSDIKHSIISIDKIRQTPGRFPRKQAQIAKTTVK